MSKNKKKKKKYRMEKGDKVPEKEMAKQLKKTGAKKREETLQNLPKEKREEVRNFMKEIKEKDFPKWYTEKEGRKFNEKESFVLQSGFSEEELKKIGDPKEYKMKELEEIQRKKTYGGKDELKKKIEKLKEKSKKEKES